MLKPLLCRVSAACVAWLYRSHALECVGRVVHGLEVVLLLRS